MRTVKPKVLKKGGKQRYGKGFSKEELKKAGLNPKEALRLHIPIDSRRRTSYEENVDTIKNLLGNKKPASKPKRKSKS
ncbi:MAG: ribosomal protein L13e [Candidatus Bathyarchaeota archaeon]|nr:ribosomal protein L13e [Candidatus Bathyarchaeota archaeon]MDH5786858.1 ribosomal protein L13e [Candidatus Bathyarchaeota archaeon]